MRRFTFALPLAVAVASAMLAAACYDDYAGGSSVGLAGDAAALDATTTDANGNAGDAGGLPPLSPVCQTACDKASPTNDQSWSICYSCKCKQAIGALPPPTKATCANGKDIHVFTAELVDGGVAETDQPDDQDACDNPALLDSLPRDAGCTPGGKLGQETLQNGAVYKFICRRQPGLSRTAAPRYIDHGIIAHNPKNGATCFWVDHAGNSDGVLPGVDITDGDPAKVAAYMAFWDAQQEGDHCVECHDNDPFMYSPHLKSVFDFQTKAYLFGPYAQVRVAGPPTAIPSRHLVSKEAAYCTDCHRISEANTCAMWLNVAAGTPLEGRNYQPEITSDAGAFYPLTTWMPHPLPPTYPTRASWDATYGATISFIKDCCAHPDQSGCVWSIKPGFTGQAP
jgi:hypothetical protein